MRTLTILVVGLLAVGCLTPEERQKALRDSVVGEYEMISALDTHKQVLLENGVRKLYRNGKKYIRRSLYAGESKWSISNGQIHFKYDSGLIEVYRINKGKSITWVASMKDGKRIDFSKEDQTTFKKIK